MLAGCSEISINLIIVKYVQHVVTIWACNLPGVDFSSFIVPWG